MFKTGLQIEPHNVLAQQNRFVEDTYYFGGGHFLLKKSVFPEIYKTWQIVTDVIDIVEGCNILTPEKGKVHNLTPKDESILKLFEPVEQNNTAVIGNGRFQKIYYWLLCEYLGCEIYGYHPEKPHVLRRDGKNVGFVIGLKIE